MEKCKKLIKNGFIKINQFSDIDKFSEEIAKLNGKKFIIDDKSLYLFSLSIKAGFSDPASPILNNLILLSFQSHVGIFYI